MTPSTERRHNSFAAGLLPRPIPRGCAAGTPAETCARSRPKRSRGTMSHSSAGRRWAAKKTLGPNLTAGARRGRSTPARITCTGASTARQRPRLRRGSSWRATPIRDGIDHAAAQPVTACPIHMFRADTLASGKLRFARKVASKERRIEDSLKDLESATTRTRNSL
jgi:hypothetical protein